MPSGEIIVIGVLLSLLNGVLQLLLVVLIYEFASLFALISYKLCVSPFLWQCPDFNRFVFGG